MLIVDRVEIGERLRLLRKRAGRTQAELAEAAGIADRTYADIERGTATMRLDTLLSICRSLRILPNDLLVQNNPEEPRQCWPDRLLNCTDHERETAAALLNIYLTSVGK